MGRCPSNKLKGGRGSTGPGGRPNKGQKVEKHENTVRYRKGPDVGKKNEGGWTRGKTKHGGRKVSEKNMSEDKGSFFTNQRSGREKDATKKHED